MDAVNAWGIKPDSDRYQELFDEITKSAAVEEVEQIKFALVLDYGEGRKESYYPCANILEIEKSARVLSQHCEEGRLPSAAVVTACRMLKEAARREDMEDEMPAFISRLAREREFDPERALALVGTRKSACVENPENFDLYQDLVKGAAADREQLEECIRLMDDLDRRLDVKYSHNMPMPHEVFHCGMTTSEFQKFASSQVVIAGVMVPQQVVAMMKESAVSQFWTKAKADQLVPVVKAAANNSTSDAACDLVDALEPALQAEFLTFLLDRC
jgi:hypothetical protein